MIPVFSYPTLFGDVDLEVLAVAVDGADLPYAKVSKTERTVALHNTGRAEWDLATLRVRATLPTEEVADGPWSDVTCLAIVTEKATNLRVAVPLDPTGDGHWEGSVELAQANHSRRATVTLVVVASVGGVDGRLIGSTRDDWYVDLTASEPVRQRAVDIVNADFTSGPPQWLNAYRDSTWVVDTTGDTPVVYLNTAGVEGLLDILEGNGAAPTEKLIRELVTSQIAQDAWTAMFHTAIADLDVDDDGTPLMPTGWRGSVLDMMLPDVMPGRPAADALYEINHRRTNGFGWSSLQTSIQFAAGRRSRITKKLTTAVRTAATGEAVTRNDIGG